MKPEDLHRLIEEYRDGTIGAEDAGRLAEAIRDDADVAREVHRALAFSGFLGQALDLTSDASFGRSFSERVAAEHGGEEFMTDFARRAAQRPGLRPARKSVPRSSGLPWVAAATLLLGLAGFVFWRTGRAPEALVTRKKPAPPPTEEPIRRLPEAARLPAPPPRPEPAPPGPPAAPALNEVPAPSPAAPAAPAPDPPVADPPPAPVPATLASPVPGVARLDRVEGEAWEGLDGRRVPTQAGRELAAGVSLSTGSGGSWASLVLSDGTRLRMGPESVLREIVRGPRGARAVLSLGTFVADVAHQPPDQPLLLVTPHGEARVLGTVLRLVVEPGSTRLEVREGKVRLLREGKFVDVPQGQFAVAAPGTGLVCRSLAPEEIVLWPHQARLTGAEWTLKPDPRSLSGTILEAGPAPFRAVDHVESRPSYATYTFFAPAEKEYRIWLRMTSFEKGDPWTRDQVTLEPKRAQVNLKSPFFGASPTLAWVVTGVASTPGYSWVSSHGEDGRGDPPLSVKFAETGFQTLRLYVDQPWIRVDAIWLSATQKTRPPAKQPPPAGPAGEK